MPSSNVSGLKEILCVKLHTTGQRCVCVCVCVSEAFRRENRK